MEQAAPSLKKRLTTTLTLALAALAIVVNTAVFQFVRHMDLEEFDSALRNELHTIATMTTVEHLDPIEIEMELHEFDPPEFQASPDAKYYQLWNQRGETFLKSRSLGDADLANLAPENSEYVIRDVRLPDGRAGRIACTCAIVGPQAKHAPRPDERALVQSYGARDEYRVCMSLAVSREKLDHILGVELALSILTALILIGGAVGMVHWITNRHFRKFGQLADEMRSIDYGSLSTRLPENGLPRELLPFATQFNSLLARLKAGVEREKRFATNISHELRTPISELRLLTEVGKRECDRGDMEDVATYFDDATELTVKMDRLVETVSAFNNLASGREKPVIDAFHLAPIVNKACEAHAAKASEREITVDCAVPTDAIMKSDRSLVSAIFGNLIGNAVSHAPVGSTVSVTARLEGSRYRVVIENPNTELEPDDLGKLGEPFWQKDSARSGSEHFGMGVALVEAYCKLVDIDCAFSLPKAADVFRVSLGIVAAGKSNGK